MARSPPAPSPRPPPGHVLPSFLKGGLGISVGVVGPVAAPSPRCAPRAQPPPLAARRGRGGGSGGGGGGGISPQRHTPPARRGPLRPRTPPRPPPCLPLAAHTSAGPAAGGARPPLPPLGPAEPAPSQAPRKQQRPPRPLLAGKRRARAAAGLAPCTGAGGRAQVTGRPGCQRGSPHTFPAAPNPPGTAGAPSQRQGLGFAHTVVIHTQTPHRRPPFLWERHLFIQGTRL